MQPPPVALLCCLSATFSGSWSVLSAVASLNLETFMRNNKSYSISAQRASPGAHFRGIAREKTALLQSLLNLQYESQSAPPRRRHRPRNSRTNPAPASIPATSALAPGDGDGRAAVTSGSGGGRCGGDVRQRRRRQAVVATVAMREGFCTLKSLALACTRY